MAALILEILEAVRLAPQAADAFSAWFRATPDATPEQIRAMLDEWKAERAKTQAAVDEFNEGL